MARHATGETLSLVSVYPARPPEGTVGRLVVLRLLLMVAFPAGALAISVSLLVAGLPDYGRNIAYEHNAMTWVQSTTLMLAAFLACVLLIRSWLTGRIASLCALVALVLVLLAIDDQFYFHERIRDDLLSDAPRLLPWSAPGDVLPPLIASAAFFS